MLSYKRIKDNLVLNQITYNYSVLKRLTKGNYLFLFGVSVCLIWIILALLAPTIAPYTYSEQNLEHRFEPPSSGNIFGTDGLGRDVFSRVLYGSRITLIACIMTVALSSIIGIIYGGIAGYAGGILDEVMMRIAELVHSFPPIILAMVLLSALGPGLYNTLLAMVIVWWPNYARVMRSLIIANKNNEYVLASKSLGASNFRILTKELMPNSIGPVLILATLDLGNAILTFSGLSFLGFGEAPPVPEWGAMVADGVTNFHHWWIGTFPGLAILTIAMGANFIGDGLRDYLDPKLRRLQ